MHYSERFCWCEDHCAQPPVIGVCFDSYCEINVFGSGLKRPDIFGDHSLVLQQL